MSTSFPIENSPSEGAAETTTRWPVHKAFSGRRFPGADDESDTDADISFTMECLYALPEDEGLQSCKFIKRPKKQKKRSPVAEFRPKTPKMTISSPMAGPRMSPAATTLGIASPKLSPVVGSVRRSNLTPDYAAAARWNDLAPEDCKTPESTRPPHYSPKTRRRLRLTFDFAQQQQQQQPGEPGDEGGGGEVDEGDGLDFWKRRRST